MKLILEITNKDAIKEIVKHSNQERFVEDLILKEVSKHKEVGHKKPKKKSLKEKLNDKSLWEI